VLFEQRLAVANRNATLHDLLENHLVVPEKVGVAMKMPGYYPPVSLSESDEVDLRLEITEVPI
jgi:hypothetical protein